MNTRWRHTKAPGAAPARRARTVLAIAVSGVLLPGAVAPAETGNSGRTKPISTSPALTRSGAARLLTGTVVDEKDRPLAGADVVFLAEPLGQRVEVAAQTDDQGRFTLAAPRLRDGRPHWPPGSLWACRAGRRLALRPLFHDSPSPPHDLRLVLAAPAKVQVKVLDPSGQELAGAAVSTPTVAFEVGANLALPRTIAERTAATTNDQGLATLTAVAGVEIVELHVATATFGRQVRYSTPDRARNRLTVRLRPVGRVQGRLLAAQPEMVRHAHVFVISVPLDQGAPDSPSGAATAESDDQGHFEISALAEGRLQNVYVEAKGDRSLLPTPPRGVILRAGATAQLDIPFQPAVRIRGLVREKATGKPMPDIVARLLVEDEPSAAVRTGHDGCFELLSAAGTMNLVLERVETSAVPGWFHHPRPLIVPKRVKQVELPPIELALAEGLVLDDAGRPIAGAKVEQVSVRLHGPDGEFEVSAVHGGNEPLETNADGRYRAWVDAHGTYRVAIRAADQLPKWSEWIDFSRHEPFRFPDLVCRRLQAVTGRVADRQGRPVADAVVFQSGDGPLRTKVKTGKDGRFRLEGFRSGSAFLFVERSGYRFHGQAVTAGADDVTVVVVEHNEPPARQLKTLPSTLKTADESALARRLLVPSLNRAIERGDGDDKLRLLELLAGIDPDAALEAIDQARLPTEAADMVRAEVVKQWSAARPDDARRVIESIPDSASRALAYVEAAQAVPASRAKQKLAWLAQARSQLPRIAGPLARVVITSQVASQLFDAGAADDAKELARRAAAEAERLPEGEQSGFARGSAAEPLAVLDPEAAAALLKSLPVDERDRHLGNIAVLLAGVNPIEAHDALANMRGQFERNQCAVRVAYFMAQADFDRASAVARSISDVPTRAYALGVMARAAAAAKSRPPRTDRAQGGKTERRKKIEPRRGLELLREAFDVLAALADSADTSHPLGYHSAPVLAAALLPTVEAIEPALVDEFFWRALSLRLPLEQQGDSEQTIAASHAYMAMFLARYDRSTARRLLEPVVVETPRGDTLAAGGDTLDAAVAVVDPAWAVELFENRTRGRDEGSAAEFAGETRRNVVKVLARHGADRWNAALELLPLWVPGSL